MWVRRGGHRPHTVAARGHTGLPVPGATYIDVRPEFCRGQDCPVTVDDLLVYRDYSHITADHASYLAPIIDDRLTLATGPAP